MLIQPLGVASLTEQWPVSVGQVAFREQLASGGAGVVWMLEFEPFTFPAQSVQLQSMAGPGLAPLGVAGFGELYISTINVAAAASTERHASIAINTGAAEVPAKAEISNRLIHDRLQVRRDLPRLGERLGGFLAETAATLSLDASDGALDYLLDQRILRDRPIRIKSASTTRLANGQLQVPAMAQMATNFEGRIVNAQLDTDGRLNFTVGDGWKRIDRPVQEQLYLGTGGREGGLDLAGKPIPLSYGNCPNITPACIDRIKGVYQVHDGESLEILPRDMGVYLHPGPEVDTFEQLLALSQEGETDEPQIPLGTAALCRPEGMFRVAGGSQITADVQGDGINDGPVSFDNGVLFDNGVGFDAPGRRTFRRYPGGMIYRILSTRARIADAELDINQMLQFDREHPYECGIFIGTGERPTVREVCTRIADSAGALVVRNRFGQIILRAMEPATPTSPIVLNQAKMALQVERLPLPWGAPWPSLKLYYAPNWTPMTEEQISDQFAADSAEKAVLLGKSKFLEVTHPEMAPLLPDREDLEVQTVLRSEADALTVARRIIDFYAGRWALWRVVALGIPWRLDVMATVILQLPRFGWQDGRPALVIGLEERPGEYETELTLM